MRKIKISNLFYLKWIQKYKDVNKWLFYFILYAFLFLSFIFFAFLIFIIPFIYLGIILQRKRFYTLLVKKINNIKEKYNLIVSGIIKFILLCILLITIVMIFPIVFYVFILIGVFFEKRKYHVKSNKNPLNIQYQSDKPIKTPICYSKSFKNE